MRITTAEIPPDWKEEIEEIARTTGRTSGEVVREALAQYLSETDPLTGQLAHANRPSFRQLMVGLCCEIYNSTVCIPCNLTPVIEYCEKLLHLLHLYAQYYSPPIPEIQQYVEEIDLEFLMEDLPKLLSSLKEGAERILQICQSYQNWCNAFGLEDVQTEVMREAIAQYLSKTLFLPNQLVQTEAPSLELIVDVCSDLNNPIIFVYGNCLHLDDYAKNLLKLEHLYAQYHSPTVSEIQEYTEAIDFKFFVESLLNLINTLKLDSQRIHQWYGSLRTFFRLDTRLIDIHEKLDCILMILRLHQSASADSTRIQVIKEYGSVPQIRWNSGQLASALATILILAILTLEESTISKLEAKLKKSDLQPLDPILKPTLRICTQVDEKNQIVIRIGDYRIQLSLDSEQRPHAEAEPAITWGNGYGLYCYHGVTLPEKYVKLPPSKWQAQWILSQKNAELRRVLIQGIGYARICTELQAIELDSWAEYSLLKIDQIIDIDREAIYLLKMTCLSTGFIHALRVPPNIQSAREAITWVNWGIDPLEFSVQT